MDDEHFPPAVGGCWICGEGNGFEDDDMVFDTDFDAFVHRECLEEHDVESILGYELKRDREDYL